MGGPVIDRNYVMLAGRWAAIEQLGKLHQRQHLDQRIAWIEGTDFCSIEDDRSWSYYAVRLQYKTCNGITLQSLFLMVTCHPQRQGREEVRPTTACPWISSDKHSKLSGSLFPPPHSPQRSTPTHTDVTLTRAECLIDCKGVTTAQWLCWEDTHCTAVVRSL